MEPDRDSAHATARAGLARKLAARGVTSRSVLEAMARGSPPSLCRTGTRPPCVSRPGPAHRPEPDHFAALCCRDDDRVGSRGSWKIGSRAGDRHRLRLPERGTRCRGGRGVLGGANRTVAPGRCSRSARGGSAKCPVALCGRVRGLAGGCSIRCGGRDRCCRDGRGRLAQSAGGPGRLGRSARKDGGSGSSRIPQGWGKVNRRAIFPVLFVPLLEGTQN